MLNEKMEQAARLMQFGQDIGEKIQKTISTTPQSTTVPFEQIQASVETEMKDIIAWTNTPPDADIKSEMLKAEMRKFALAQAVKRAQDQIGARLRELKAHEHARTSPRNASWFPYIIVAFLAGSTLTMIVVTWLTRKHPTIAL